jgi:hypothetical protein
MTPQEILAQLQRARDAMLDPLDIPRTWTERQAEAYERCRASLDAHAQAIHVSMNSINKPTARLATAIAARDRLLAIQATLEQQIADAPNPRGLGGGIAEQKAWGRQQGLTDSLKALRDGVPQFNGEPQLPGLLREALTTTCSTCGHSSFSWPGPLVQLEREIAADEKKIRELRTSLESNLKSAEALLAAKEEMILTS